MVAFYIPGMTNALYNSVAPRAQFAKGGKAKAKAATAAVTPAPVVNADYTFAPAVEDYLFDPIRMKAANETVTPAVAQEALLPTAESYVQQGLSPDVAAAVAAYQADPYAMMAVDIPGVGMVQAPATAAALNAANAPYIPGNPVYDASADFVFNTDVEGFNATPQRITYLPGQEYRLLDARTGDVLGTAKSPEELRDLSAKAVQFSNEGGQKASYALQRAEDGDWGTLGQYHYDPLSPLQVAGQFVSTLGSVAAAGLVPGLGPLQAMGVSAAPQVVGGALQGQSIGEIAKNAGMAAALTYAGKQLPGVLDSIKSAPDVTGGALSSAGSTGSVAGGLGDLVVTASKFPTAAVAGLTGGAQALSNIAQAPKSSPTVEGEEIAVTAGSPSLTSTPITAAGALSPAYNILSQQPQAKSPLEEVQQQLEQQQQQAAEENQLTVTAANGTPAFDFGAAAAPALSSLFPDRLPTTQGGEAVVTAKEKPPVNIGAGASGLLPTTYGGEAVVTAKEKPPVNIGTANVPLGGGLSQTSPTVANPETVVTAKEKEPVNLGAGAAGALTSTTTPPSTQQTTDAAKEKQVDKDTTLDDIIKYLRLAGLGVGLIGDLVGGGGSNSQQGVIPAGFGKGRSPIFSATLPAANMPGLAAGAGPRTAADLGGQGLASAQDYYRYGYGPEQSFRTNVPAAPRNTSTAYTGYEVPFEGLEKMARGGFAVGGPGDGRDDKIPAMLSDGEYVIDAETVAMLGNGSTKAGADALDKFRVNIRKHKGRALSKGKFSDNAKKPEQYLKKGRR